MTRSKNWILCPYHNKDKCGFEICMIKNGANFWCSGLGILEKGAEASANSCATKIADGLRVAALEAENDRLRNGLRECECGLMEDLRQIREHSFEANNIEDEVVITSKCTERLSGRLGMVRGVLRGHCRKES